jgi:hypothetical protein
MRAPIAGIVIWAVLPLVDASAATKLMPAEIQSTFFTGEAFNATTPSGGVKFKMVFTPDGKVTRTPLSKGGARGEGSWKLDNDGFCNTWKGKMPNCFIIMADGANKWSVMKGTAPVAVWSK